MDRETKQGVIRWVIKTVIGISIFMVLIFLSAGDFGWQGGWWVLALNGVNILLTGLLLVRLRPELVARRSRMGKNTQPWDKGLALLMAWGPLVIGVISGLAYRFGGGVSISWPVRLAACGVATLGSFLTNWAMLHNPFFEGTVRIQTEEGHVVATGGPYRWVRHPGYVGALLFSVLSPLIFGVLWGFIGVGIFVVGVVIRTAREDRFLLQNLPGYAGYSRRTKYRLIPGIW